MPCIYILWKRILIRKNMFSPNGQTLINRSAVHRLTALLKKMPHIQPVKRRSAVILSGKPLAIMHGRSCWKKSTELRRNRDQPSDPSLDEAGTLPTESCRSNTKFAPNIYNSVERNCTIRLSVIVFHCPSIFICFCFSIISFWF